MQLPLQVTFRHMETSEALLADIEKTAEKLDHFSDHIISCRVVIELPHQHHHQGKLFHVSIDLTVPGGEVYFHRNSVLYEQFGALEIGSEVRYAEEPGEEGMQASTVALIGKHHIFE